MYAYYAAIRNGTGRDIMIKLLIVDDEHLVQIGIKSMLRWDELGIEVCGTAMNGKAALEMIRQYRPDIVIYRYQNACYERTGAGQNMQR